MDSIIYDKICLIKLDGITSDRVLAKNRHIEKSSKLLWEYIKGIVADGVQKGYLKE